MKRVLIIDDDDDIREVAQLSLEVTGGWEVDTQADGERGIAAALANPPDLILLDYMMPGIDGPATLKRLKGDPKTASVPVLILTARTSANMEGDMKKRGAVGVLAKPFDPMGLGDEINKRLGWE